MNVGVKGKINCVSPSFKYMYVYVYMNIYVDIYLYNAFLLHRQFPAGGVLDRLEEEPWRGKSGKRERQIYCVTLQLDCHILELPNQQSAGVLEQGMNRICLLPESYRCSRGMNQETSCR